MKTIGLTSKPLLWLAIGAFALLGVGPLIVMLQHLLEDPSALESLLTERTRTLLVRTSLLGLGASLVALAIGLPFGYLTARTDVFGAGALRVLGIVPILIPPIMVAMTWTMVTEMRGPYLCAFILGLSTFPLVAMFTARAAERIDASAEEAARLVGGNRAVVALGFPLVLPSALGAAVLCFIVSINDFALPDYVSAVGKKFNVYAGEVFSTWQVDGNEARAVATALPLICMTFLALIPVVLARRGRRFGTVSGSFRAPERLRLGRWRWPATLFCLAVVGAGAFLPLGRLFYEAGGGPRVFSGVSIRRVAWLSKGGGAGGDLKTLTDTGAASEAASNPEVRTGIVRSSQKAALEAAGIDAPVPPAGTSSRAPGVVMRKRAVNLGAPEVDAAMAARETNDMSDAYGGFPVFWSNVKQSFARAFELSRESLLASLLFAFLAATIALPIALTIGHAIRRTRLGPLLEILCLLPLIVPATLFGIGTIVLWNHEWTAAIYDSGVLVTLLFVGRLLPVPILILAGAVASYRPSLEEAARLSGAGPIRRLFTVIAPGVWPGLVGAWIAVFALAVRELDAAVLVPAANDTAMFRVFNAVHFGRDDFVSALALLVIFSVILPGLLWTLFSKARLRFLP